MPLSSRTTYDLGRQGVPEINHTEEDLVHADNTETSILVHPAGASPEKRL